MKQFDDIVVVSMARTAVGKMGGALANESAVDVSAFMMTEVLKRANLQPNVVDEVVWGNVENRSSDSCLSRWASQKAGMEVSSTGYGVNMLCGSSFRAIQNACDSMKVGYNKAVIVGGVEIMSAYPFSLEKARFGYRMGDGVLYDTLTQVLADNPDPEKRPAANTAENLCKMYDISREQQERFAVESQNRAADAIDKGRFKDEIAPYEVKEKKGSFIFDTDEHPRRGTTAEQMQKLRPIIPGGTVTAGTACGINDGASAMMLMTGEKARELGLKPMAKILGYGTGGVPMHIFGIGPVPAIAKALKMAELSIEDIQLIEINEAFAAQVIACEKEMKLDHSIVNVNGGAIALGHALGSSGTRISITLLYEMRRRGLKYGVSSACVGSGLGGATVFELL